MFLSCILSKFYIKPQPVALLLTTSSSCILSKFYIKPQQPGGDQHRTQVVSYRNSTSNHNSSRRIDNPAKLYLIEILHQTTTVRFDGSTKNGCILSKFYIKPQLIKIIHSQKNSCILSKFYIKPQPLLSTSKRSLSCILSKFYIKPQQLTPYRQPGEVVSYRNSTSNHNFLLDDFCAIAVVSYRNSTSNHNSRRILLPATIVVSYRNSTSNHNTGAKLMKDSKLYLIEILHQTTTGRYFFVFTLVLYLIEILHQTTTPQQLNLF